MSKQRVDLLLVERGLFESRAKAAAAILAGEVFIEPGGRRIDKPGQSIETQSALRVTERDRYVSRGGRKLENAIETLSALPMPGSQLTINGRRCLDAGASTGGFTDYLLQHGADHVVAVDVAYGELHWSLRNDARVTVIERRNVRELSPDELPYTPDLIVADLSFISLVKVLPALMSCASHRFDMLALVKPQFEVGRERIGKNGVVRDNVVRAGAIERVAIAARSAGMAIVGAASSGLPGPAGNRETFLWLAEHDRGGSDDLSALASMAVAAEPGEATGV